MCPFRSTCASALLHFLSILYAIPRNKQPGSRCASVYTAVVCCAFLCLCVLCMVLSWGLLLRRSCIQVVHWCLGKYRVDRGSRCGLIWFQFVFGHACGIPVLPTRCRGVYVRRTIVPHILCVLCAGSFVCLGFFDVFFVITCAENFVLRIFRIFVVFVLWIRWQRGVCYTNIFWLVALSSGTASI